MGSASRDVYEKTCQLLEKSCCWRESKDRVLHVMSDGGRSSIGAMCLHSVSSNMDAATTAAHEARSK